MTVFFVVLLPFPPPRVFLLSCASPLCCVPPPSPVPQAETDQRYFETVREPGWPSFFDEEARAAADALAAAAAIEARKAKYAGADPRKAPVRFDISSDEGSDGEAPPPAARRRPAGGTGPVRTAGAKAGKSGAGAKSPTKPAKPARPAVAPTEALEAVWEVLEDVVGVAAAVAQARFEGRLIAEDLARQARTILDRLQLVPARFPVAPAGELQLRLGLSSAQYEAFYAGWEAARYQQELADMAIAERDTWRYVRGVCGGPHVSDCDCLLCVRAGARTCVDACVDASGVRVFAACLRAFSWVRSGVAWRGVTRRSQLGTANEALPGCLCVCL